MSAHATVGSRLAEDFRAAAKVLESDGWVRQVGLHDLTTGAHDIAGAVYVATGYHRLDTTGLYRAHPLPHSAGRRATECVQFLVRSLPTNTVWEFNDRVCTSQAEAIDTLLKAADAAERSVRTHRDAERYGL